MMSHLYAEVYMKQSRYCCILALICSLTLPLPIGGHATSSGDAVSGGSLLERQCDANTAFPGSHISSPQTRQKDADYDTAVGSSSRPKSITEVMFNAVTGAVGLPGLAGNQHDPYAPNADQGLGYNPYGGYGNGLYACEPGYAPVTGQTYRYDDPTNGEQQIIGQGNYGNLDQFDPQQMLFQRGLDYGMGMINSRCRGFVPWTEPKPLWRCKSPLQLHGGLGRQGQRRG